MDRVVTMMKEMKRKEKEKKKKHARVESGKGIG